ncbi:MAG: DNA-processing protein DprA [Candidatus Cloacimonetes bacterium]|nr:DNA-processing protein DprA [Candidatus Cloacimonadota bacterium]
MERIKAWIKLISAPDVGNTLAIRLIKILGEPEKFLKNNLPGLDEINFLTPAARTYLKKDLDPENWPGIADLIEQLQIGFITYFDDNYPVLLKNIFDPPLFLFYRGNPQNLSSSRCLAVVGTRRPSNYGRIMTGSIVRELCQAGFTIVSGLADGIDSYAHQAALESGGLTMAVMATGVDRVYPHRNRGLAAKIVEQGLLMSEYLPGADAERWNFPARNRVISGICSGCFVVEGAAESGALLTAKFALDQNRNLYALPGDVNRPQAEGPNLLLKMGAKPVTSAADILEDYDLKLVQENVNTPLLSEQERKVYEIIVRNKPEISFDQLLIESHIAINHLSSVILSLELKSMIRKIPGNRIAANI